MPWDSCSSGSLRIWPPFVFLLSHELGDICVSCYLNSSGMIASSYLDVNAFVFFISQPDWVYFLSLSFVAGARGCLQGGGGNICVLRGRRQEPNSQVPVQPLQMWPQRDAHPFFHGALWLLGIGENVRWKCNINADHHIRYYFTISDVEGDVYLTLKALLNLFSQRLENNCRFDCLPTQVH